MNEQMTEKEFVAFGAEIYVSNLAVSIKFYSEVLGFSLIRLDNTHNFASFEFNNAILMIEERKDLVAFTTGIVLRFLAPDLKDYYESIIKRGASILKPLTVKDYGASRFYVKDPDGYQLKFFSK